MVRFVVRSAYKREMRIRRWERLLHGCAYLTPNAYERKYGICLKKHYDVTTLGKGLVIMILLNFFILSFSCMLCF